MRAGFGSEPTTYSVVLGRVSEEERENGEKEERVDERFDNFGCGVVRGDEEADEDDVDEDCEANEP